MHRIEREIIMKKFFKSAAAFAAVGAVAFAGAGSAISPLLIEPKKSASAVDDTNDDWLHAEGSRLYDMNGNEVWLTGANWFGMNCS